MALTRTFNDMLKRHMPYQLLVELMKRKSYFWSQVKKNSNWYGGRLEVPFLGNPASSIVLGGYADATDIAEETDVLGYEDAFRFLGQTMKFNSSDLDLHKTSEASFIPNLMKSQMQRFMNNVGPRFSHLILNGSAIDSITADATSGGLVTVNFPERFVVGQAVILRNNDPAAGKYYVTAIDMATKKLTVSATRGGSAADVSAYTLAKVSKLYEDGGVNTSTGALQNNFNSLRGALLSATNGGDSSIHNQTKTSYTHLQAHQADGSGITSSSILETLYDAIMDVKRIAKGAPVELLCSYKNFKVITKELEANRDFANLQQESIYGFNKITIASPRAGFSVVPIEEMDDDVIYIIDWDAFEFAGSHFFKRESDPDGNEWYKTRATTGYTYIVDTKLYGNLIVKMPSHCGVIHSISF